MIYFTIGLIIAIIYWVILVFNIFLGFAHSVIFTFDMIDQNEEPIDMAVGIFIIGTLLSYLIGMIWPLTIATLIIYLISLIIKKQRES